ncbi:MAG: uncharacterized protein QOJ72_2987 [Nocardioidaceae bacterium]|nr:uncharacterized protein [Nocardioidaceae bacterium]
MAIHLSREEARRIAVQAQLLDASRPTNLVEIVRQLAFVQVEPTAAVAPTADLVLWSRLGDSYDPEDLRSAVEDEGSLFELSLMIRPMEDLALFRASMAAPPRYESTERWLEVNQEFREDILELLEVEGAKTAREIPDTSVVPWSSSGWNNNRNVMMMLECMMLRGEIAMSSRRGRDRVWDLAERVYHSDIPTVPLEEALTILAERRLRAEGLVPDKTPDLPAETTRVGDAGEAATIEGVKGTYRVDPGAIGRPFAPRTALLSPFDGLIRDRKRMQELFEFDYTLEMYKPKAKRRWGYYALPILHGDRLVGKVDAKAEHTRGELVVSAIHEDAPFSPDIAEGVRTELDDLARWLELDLTYL